MIFNFWLSEVVVFTKKNFVAGTHSSEGHAIVTSVAKVHGERDCIGASIEMHTF